MHPWHDISPGESAPLIVDAVIEISRGSRAKYEIDKPSGLLRLDRVLFSSVHYPVNYGIIPQALWYDGDPLDILVICSEDIRPLSIVRSRVVGLMRMNDSGDPDEKIIAVPEKDMAYAHIHDISDIPPHWIEEVRNFFDTYKRLEGKEVRVGEFSGRESAFDVIREGMDLYRKKFKQ